MPNDGLFAYTADELIAEAEREAQMRRWVYSNRVADRRMSRLDANSKIDRMDAIVSFLKRCKERGILPDAD